MFYYSNQRLRLNVRLWETATPQRYCIGVGQTRIFSILKNTTMYKTDKNALFQGVDFGGCNVMGDKPSFIYRVMNDTMKPLIIGGDFVRLEQTKRVINGEIYAILPTYDNELIIRFLTDAGERYILQSPNERFTDFTIEKTEVSKIYKVCAVLRII